jgi:hypothetical protein
MATKKRPTRRPQSKPSFASCHPQPSTADALIYTEYDITDEPLENRDFKRLPAQVQARIDDLYELAQRDPSTLSSLNFGVEPPQFHAGVFDTELPVDAALLGIGFLGPRGDFGLPFGQFPDAAIAQTLARQAAPFACGDIQPTAVFRRVAEVEAFDVGSRPLRCTRFLAGAFGVRVEVVANEGHLCAVGIARVQHLGDFDRPVSFGPPSAGGRLPEARQRFGEHENAGRAIAFICIIDTLAMLLRRCDRHPRLLEQRDGLFVHAQHGMLRIVGRRVGCKHFCHASHALSILLRRHPPVGDLPLRHAVFFRTLRTVS